MTKFVAKRIQFRNGERHAVLSRVGGVPVHEVTLFLARFRTKGRRPNTVYQVCAILALLYRWLTEAEIDLLGRLRNGQFLTIPEIHRLADLAQYRADDLTGEDEAKVPLRQVVDINTVRKRRKKVDVERLPVGVANHAMRLRYFARYFEFIVGYVAATLPRPARVQLEEDAKRVLEVLRAQIPEVRAGERGSREGMSADDQNHLLAVVRPDSPQNPWKRPFVRQRNWLIVMLLLATGMRRGELLSIRLDDLRPNKPLIDIVRRLHDPDDPRMLQPTPKTRERSVELRPAIMKAVWEYIAMRGRLTAARRHPYLIVADEGAPFGYKTVDRIFADIRRACPGLEIDLSSHVMRHTWNDRFSEQAELMALSEVAEERARNEQQGWADNSKSAATYTRRYAASKGRELSLKLQEKLDVPDQ
ncbi:site-specific integrase [Paracidovorax konjaci]|uniref:Phage integrase family protein n=1 Tax=Paracidovorax konjaci TaxID=32040 RepID=A0A1I1XJ45_9BURK|nr:site-specific integrase [Paracidovorax konjaci]SFE07419.1 Phage integrase family protein [Paracidovorax konjaci]